MKNKKKKKAENNKFIIILKFTSHKKRLILFYRFCCCLLAELYLKSRPAPMTVGWLVIILLLLCMYMALTFQQLWNKNTKFISFECFFVYFHWEMKYSFAIAIIRSSWLLDCLLACLLAAAPTDQPLARAPAASIGRCG